MKMAQACLWMRPDTGGPIWRRKRAGLVTLRMTFSERELIPSYNRLRDRYGKLQARYLGCLGDHQSTGAGGDAAVLKEKRACVCVCVSWKNIFVFFSPPFFFFLRKICWITSYKPGNAYFIPWSIFPFSFKFRIAKKKVRSAHTSMGFCHYSFKNENSLAWHQLYIYF